jgi:hypothetical protein
MIDKPTGGDLRFAVPERPYNWKYAWHLHHMTTWQNNFCQLATLIYLETTQPNVVSRRMFEYWFDQGEG